MKFISIIGYVALSVGLCTSVARAIKQTKAKSSSKSTTPVPAEACTLCALLTVGQLPGHEFQILGLDLRKKESCVLGSPIDMEIDGLSFNPKTRILYAVTKAERGLPGKLYSVNRETGDMTSICSHDFKAISDIAFRQSDATLWGWAKDDGLVQFDIVSGKATVQFESKKKFLGLAWTDDGTTLYAVNNDKEIWSYNPVSKNLNQVAKNLPKGTSAIEMRSDGILVGITSSSTKQGKSSDSIRGSRKKYGSKAKKQMKSTKESQKQSMKKSKKQSTKESKKGDSVNDQAHYFLYDPISAKIISQHMIPVPKAFSDLSGLAWPSKCGTASLGGRVDMIESITVQSSSPACLGEDLMVAVEAIHPLGRNRPVDITINGLNGSPQYLTFSGLPGQRLIGVTASTEDQYFDFEDISVDVIKCADAEFLEVGASINPFNADTVDFEVLNANEFGGQGSSYSWDFGDGQTLMNNGNVPYASHSYAELIRGTGRDQPQNAVLVTITLSRTGRPNVVSNKMVSIWNTYASNKSRGIIQLPVDTNGPLQTDGTQWSGSYTIINIEDTTVRFAALDRSYVPCDPDQDVIAIPAETIVLELRQKQSVTRSVNIPVGEMSSICDVNIVLSGSGPEGQVVYATAHLSTAQRNHFTTTVVSDESLRDLLNHVSNQGLILDPFRATDEELYTLARRQEIVFPPPTTRRRQNLRHLDSPEMCVLTQCNPNTDPDHCIGQPCSPGDLTRPGVSCQTTEDWCTAPAHIANALKGDILTSVACGIVGNLLRNLSPSQHYSHTGIMTRNYYEVTHSTASEERLHKLMTGYGGSDGFVEGALRYGWPGVITQQISHAFNGEIRVDPSGAGYDVASFSKNPRQCHGDNSFAYPLVVKPPPGSPKQVREKLIAAADTALEVAQNRMGHYRLYAFSSSDIAESLAAPSTFGASSRWNPARNWAENTLAHVCSTFIWYCLKKNNIKLEGTVEEADVALGAMVDHATPDGLYYYTESERVNAARWLFNDIHNQAYGLSGWAGDLILDAADNIANQLVNCFASDKCQLDTSESENWRNPGAGHAVSPDDIVNFWDSPSEGGVYGYNEPLVYRGGDYVRVSKWQVSEGAGTINALVLDRGAPVSGATIEIAGISGSSDNSGRFVDDMIPQGTYEIYAYKLIGGFLKSVRREVVIRVGTTTSVTLQLEMPPQYNRRVTVTGYMKLVDDETWPLSDEVQTWSITEAKRLDIYERDTSIFVTHCVGGEVRGELRLGLHLREADNTSVEIRKVPYKGENAHFWLFEGTDCDTDDLEFWVWWGGNQNIIVPAGGTVTLGKADFESSEFMGGDTAELELTVTNLEETFP